jgi:hypothetical protein
MGLTYGLDYLLNVDGKQTYYVNEIIKIDVVKRDDQLLTLFDVTFGYN